MARISGDWKDVVHIREGKGPRGGEYWFLTLECGHHKSVPRPPFRPEMVMTMLRRPSGAPKRVRCLYCGAPSENESQPSDSDA